tara:strand:- start:1437 stop:2900 length:1464 start_codon:yes stop_codon:yes gene_type:complete
MKDGRYLNSLVWLRVVFASIVFLMGLIVIIGWYLHSSAIVQIYPSFAPMQYNTAFCFLLLGLAILSIGQYPKVSAILVVIVFCIGLLTLFQYLSGVNTGLDEVFMKHDILTKTSHPGRMAPNTALSFCFLSISVFLSSLWQRKANNISAFFALLTTLLGLFSLLGYLSGISEAYGWGDVTRMAVHTSVAFVLSGLAMLLFSFRRTIFFEYKNKMFWPILAVIIGFFIFGSIWRYLNQYESKQIDIALNDHSKLFAEKFTESLERDMEAIERLFIRINHQDYASEVSLNRDVNNYLKHMPFLYYIKIKDKVYLRHGFSKSRYGEIQRACQQAFSAKNESTEVNDVIYVGINNGLCVRSENDDNLAVLQLDSMLSSELDKKRQTILSVRLLSKGKLLAQYDQSDGGLSGISVRQRTNFYGRIWQFDIIPSKEYIQSFSTWLPIMFLVFGFAISMLAGLVIFLLRISKDRAAKNKLEASSDRLRRSDKKD